MPILTTPDEAAVYNQASLELLLRNITLYQGEFSPILAVCNYASLRKSMVEALRRQSPIPIQSVCLPKKAPMLMTAILSRLESSHPSALMVFGLEQMMQLERVLNRANRIREEFRNHLAMPLIIWVNDPTLTLFTRNAPDFYSWMPVAIRFELANSDLVALLEQQVDTEFNRFLSPPTLIENLPVTSDRHQQPYTELDCALQELQQRGQPLDAHLMAGVQFVQGRSALARNQLDQARRGFERSLSFFMGRPLPSEAELRGPTLTSTLRMAPMPLPLSAPSPSLSFNQGDGENAPSLSDQAMTQWAHQACVSFHLGLMWRVQASSNRADYQPLCALARGYFQHCLDIFRQLDRPDLVAQYLPPLGEVLHRLGEWTALEQLAQEGMALHQQFADPIRLANDYGLLAAVASSRQQWPAAKELAMNALNHLDQAEENAAKSPDVVWAHLYHRDGYRLTLAEALHQLGDIDTAIATLETARHDSNPRYDASLAIAIRSYLQQLYYDQGHYRRAFQLKQEQRSMEQQFGFRAFLGAGQLQPQQQVINPLQTQTDPSYVTIDREITASGRRQDVDALLSRLREARTKLIVIHGPSGVGKSSILSAALVPELHQCRLEEREVLPILVRRYDQWEEDIASQLATLSPDDRYQALNPLTQPPSQVIQTLSQDGYFSILLFDQFEEFFFNENHTQVEQRLPFYRFLRDCLNTPFVKVVLVLREDYLHYLLEFDRLTNLDIINNDILSNDIRYYLGDFTPSQATEVIRSATQHTPYQPHADLIEQLVADLAGTLGQVRPIELQIVGAELQDSNITTLAGYQALGNHPKETLVTRSLQRVIEDCGKAPAQQELAQLVLYLLTDDKEHRLQRTPHELADDLMALGLELSPTSDLLPHLHPWPSSTPTLGLSGDPEATSSALSPLAFLTSNQRYLPLTETTSTPPPFSPQWPHDPPNAYSLTPTAHSLVPYIPPALNLILNVLHGSGILLYIPSSPEPRYQIVHDYLVSYIRQQVKPTWLIELEQERQRRQQAEANLQTKVIELDQALAQETQERQRAEWAEIDALSLSCEALFLSHDQLGALLAGVKAGLRLQTIVSPLPLSIRAKARLRHALYNLNESNRLQGHRDWVLTAKFSPDGQHILSGGEDGTLRLWSVTGTCLGQFEGHQGWVLDANFSPDGQQIISGGTDNTIKRWTLTGECLQTLEGHHEMVWSVQFSPDGRQIISGSEDYTIKLWDEVGNCLQTFSEHRGRVWSVQFSPDGRQIISGSEDKTIKLWTLDGQCLHTFTGHYGPVQSVRFSPHGHEIISSSADSHIKLWNRSGECLQTFSDHRARVLSVQFSADGKQVVSGSADKTIKLWNLAGYCLQTLSGHQSTVWSVGFSPDGRQIVSGGEDSTVRVWTLTRSCIETFSGHYRGVNSISVSPDGAYIVSSGDDTTVKLWNLQGECVRTLEGHRGWVLCARFSPDGQRIVSGGQDNSIRLWTREGECVRSFKGYSGGVNDLQFSPDGQRIISGSDDQILRLWTLEGDCIQTFVGHTTIVSTVGFSPDGQTIVSGSEDGTIKCWNLEGQCLQTWLGHQDSVSTVRFSPDGTHIFSGSKDNTIRHWSLDGCCLQVIEGNHRRILSLDISPDGQLLASSGADGMVRLWSVTGDCLQTFAGHHGLVWAVTFSPDGQRIISGGEDHLVKVWNLDLEELLTLGLAWLRNYLATNPQVSAADRTLGSTR